MVRLSLRGLTPPQVAVLLDCDPATVRRWIRRFNDEGLADRPRCGRPGPWTRPRIRRHLGYPQVSMRTLYRRVRLVAIWRRPKLTARGDPDLDTEIMWSPGSWPGCWTCRAGRWCWPGTRRT